MIAISSQKEFSMWVIEQWGRVLFRGTKQECQAKKREWAEKCGNVELVVRRGD